MCISLLLGFFVFKKSHISFIIVVIYSHLFIFLLDVPFFNILISFYWFRIDEFDELSGVFVNVVLFMRFCLLLLPFLLCLYRKSQGEKEKFIVAYKRNIRETCVSIPIFMITFLIFPIYHNKIRIQNKFVSIVFFLIQSNFILVFFCLHVVNFSFERKTKIVWRR